MGEGGDREQRPGRDQSGDYGSREGGSATNDVAKLRVNALLRRRAQLRRAIGWNEAHPELVAKFNQLTHDACAGSDGGVDVAKLRRWQEDHHVIVDGAVGEKTIEAAQRELKGEPAPRLADLQTPAAGGKSSGMAPDVAALFQPTGNRSQKPASNLSSVTFSEAEAEEAGDPRNLFAPDGPDPAGDGPRLMPSEPLADRIADGSTGFNARKDDGVQVALEGAGETVEQIGESQHVLNSIENGGRGIPLAGTGATGEVGEEGGRGAFPWLKLAMAPAILNLIREGKYKEAVWLLAKQCNVSEAIEGVELACQKLGIHLSEEFLEKAAIGSAVGDVLLAGGFWVYEGLKTLKEAQEGGERDARIRMYASAFTSEFWGVVSGADESPNVGPATIEERAAVKFALRDGRATGIAWKTATPMIAEMLRREYGGNERAKHAVTDALMKKANLPGVWNK